MSKGDLTRAEALQKLQRYCAYQDRCHMEVRNKLIALGVYGDDMENVITDLIQENFLNEERYARSYVRGKVRIKKWGRFKIRQHLKHKQISDYCIKKGMEELDEELYEQNILTLMTKYQMEHSRLEPYLFRKKFLDFMHRKGYSYEESAGCLTDLEG